PLHALFNLTGRWLWNSGHRLYLGPLQVIQHAIHRPQSMAAQYLHQMYAAQQQHLMLQTAALQQHQHSPHLQSLATIQQVSWFPSRVSALRVSHLFYVFDLHVYLCIALLAAYSPVQTHALVKQQLSCPPGQRVGQHQLLLQQASGAPNHRQLQPIALRVAPQETNSNPLPLSIKRLTTPSTQSQPNNDTRAPSSSSSFSSSSPSTSIPAAAVQPQPPPLVAAPQRRTSFPQVQNQPPPPPPPLVLPRLPQNPPASLQRLSLHSVQALAVQSGRVLLTERELPVAEALVQMPYQNLPPPQTVAVDLKMHPVRRSEGPSVSRLVLCSEERKDECSPRPQRDRTPTSLSVRSVIQSPVVEEPPQFTTSSSTNSSNPPPPSPPLPPPILPAAVRGPSQPPSSPASVPGSPERILTTHVLTHLVEGFVIREGLEPFPVVPTSMLADQQASLPESQEIQTNGDEAAEDIAELGESVAGVLQCEFCGSKGYAHTFLRSKRFCSMTCVRSVSCTKRITMLRAGRWGHRPMGRRGRPPSRVNGASREHFVRQVS
uniref:FCS-type domain-containing protein n=1 Tax=Dicentrarchus labrax TaxID=13489 RepID=A0A8P4K0I4_DICLA